jgi:hypothetical protein
MGTVWDAEKNKVVHPFLQECYVSNLIKCAHGIGNMSEGAGGARFTEACDMINII